MNHEAPCPGNTLTAGWKYARLWPRSSDSDHQNFIIYIQLIFCPVPKWIIFSDSISLNAIISHKREKHNKALKSSQTHTLNVKTQGFYLSNGNSHSENSNSPVLLSVSLSEGWWTGVELGVVSPLTMWPWAGLQEVEGTWASTPLEAEQESDLGSKSVPFTVL